MKRTWWWLLLIPGILSWAVTLSSARAEDKEGVVVDLNGLKSKVPPDWKVVDIPEGLRQFRVYQFQLPRVQDDKADAEFIISSVLPGQGGSAADNLKRWKANFIPPKGKSIDDVAKVTKMKVADVEITYLDVQGTYKFKERPFDPSSKEELRPDYRMLGVVFESKKPYYFRLIGPAKTVAHHQKGFETWLKGIK